MNEAMKSLIMVVWMVCAVNSDAHAVQNNVNIEEETMNNNQPTIVWGAAQNASGAENEDIVIQAPNEGNPLGNPIVGNDDNVSKVSTPAPVSDNKKKSETSQIAPIVQSSTQGILQPDQVPLPQPSTKIENELYQSGNDIIDVQAYPIGDVSTVTEPNLQPTIVSQ